MAVPYPTPIYRIIHIRNLEILLRREGLHAPNNIPNDGLEYYPIHDEEIQAIRHTREVGISPGGVLHDYIPFYFGPRPPMLLKLNSNRVVNYTEGQKPIIYLISSIQDVIAAGLSFVFSDGHGIAIFTEYYNNLEDLKEVDWDMVYAKYWADKPDEDEDRQRRKQAEFLIHQFCPWTIIRGIAVVDRNIKDQVDNILNRYPSPMRREIYIKPEWYY